MDLDEAEPRNAEYYLELRHALDRINRQAIFENIHTEQPLDVTCARAGGGGTPTPFSQQHFDGANAKHGEYTCGGNLGGVDIGSV